MENLQSNIKQEEIKKDNFDFSAMKQEWINRVKIINPSTQHIKGYGVSHNTDLYLAPKEIMEDFEVNLTAAIIGEEFFWNLDPMFKGSKSFALALMINKYEKTTYNRNVYESLTFELKADPELFLLAAQRKEEFGSYSLPKTIVENRELILESMQYIDLYNRNKDIKEKYHLDKEIVEAHLKFDIEELYRSENYRSAKLSKRMVNHFTKKENIINLINNHYDNDKNRYILGKFYESLPEKLQLDLDIIHAVLSRNKSVFENLHPSLINDKGFALYAIEKYKCYAFHTGKELREDIDIAKMALTNHPDCFHLFPTFQENLEILNLVLDQKPFIYNLNENMVKNKELVLKCLEHNKDKNFTELFKKTEFYNEDYDIMRLAVLHKPDLLKKSKTLVDDTRLSILAMNKSSDIDLLSAELFYDKELVLKLFNNKDNINKAVKNEKFRLIYRDDEDIAKICIQNNYHAISYFPKLKANREFVEYALDCGLREISSIDASFLTDRNMITQFINKDVNNYSRIPLSLRDDDTIINTLIRNNGGYMVFFNQSSRSDDKNLHLNLIEKCPWIYEEIPSYSPFKIDHEIIITYLETEKPNNIKISEEVYKLYEAQNPEELLLATQQKKLAVFESKMPKKDYSQVNKKKI